MSKKNNDPEGFVHDEAVRLKGLPSIGIIDKEIDPRRFFGNHASSTEPIYYVKFGDVGIYTRLSNLVSVDLGRLEYEQKKQA